MADMPQVRPRDMAALVANVAETHAVVRNHIAELAAERTAYYAELNTKLNAQARLDGKVKQ